MACVGAPEVEVGFDGQEMALVPAVGALISFACGVLLHPPFARLPWMEIIIRPRPAAHLPCLVWSHHS